MGQWSKLSAKEKAQIIKFAIDNGVSDINSIRDTYNVYAGGGHLHEGTKSDSKLHIPTREEYITQKLDSIRNAVLEASRRKTQAQTTPVYTRDVYGQKYITDVLLKGYVEYARDQVERLRAQERFRAKENNSPEFIQGNTNTAYKSVRLAEAEKYLETEEKLLSGVLSGEIKYDGPLLNNCIANLSEFFPHGLPYGNQTFSNNPKKYGFSLIDTWDVKPGDLVQKVDYGGGVPIPNHAMIYNGVDSNGEPTFNYSDGSMPSTILNKITGKVDTVGGYGVGKHYPSAVAKDKEHLWDVKVYKYVGTPQDSAQWTNEWLQKYGTGIEFAKGGSIHIKHPGRLTALKERTGKTETELWVTGSKAVRKMITFARNARKWHKHDDGGYLGHRFVDGGGALVNDATYVGVSPKILPQKVYNDRELFPNEFVLFRSTNPKIDRDLAPSLQKFPLVDSQSKTKLLEDNRAFFTDYFNRYLKQHTTNTDVGDAIGKNEFANLYNSVNVYDSTETPYGGQYLGGNNIAVSRGTNNSGFYNDDFSHEMSHLFRGMSTGEHRLETGEWAPREPFGNDYERTTLNDAYEDIIGPDVWNKPIDKNNPTELFSTNTEIRREISEKYNNAIGEDLDQIIDSLSLEELTELVNTGAYIDRMKTLQIKDGKIKSTLSIEQANKIRKALKEVAQNTQSFNQGNNTYLAALGGELKSTGGLFYPFSFQKNPYLKVPAVRYGEGGKKSIPSKAQIVRSAWENENPFNIGLLKNGMYEQYDDPNGEGRDAGPGLLVGATIPDKKLYTRQELDDAAYAFGMEGLASIGKAYNEKYGTEKFPAPFDTVSVAPKLLLLDTRYQNGRLPIANWPSLYQSVADGNWAEALKNSRSTYIKDGVKYYDNDRVRRRSESIFPGMFDVTFTPNSKEFPKVTSRKKSKK